MRRILSMMLVLLTVVSLLPMSVIASEITTNIVVDETETESIISSELVEDEVEVTSPNSEYIHYTDLFYGYSYYLENDSYLVSYSNQINSVYESVYNGYLSSAEKYGTAVQYALDTIVSPTDLAKLITDKLGVTDFSYNEALDSANEVFVNYYLDGMMLNNVDSQYGKVQHLISKMNKVVSIFNKLELKSDTQMVDYTAEYYLQEAFDMLWDEGILSFLPESTVATLWSELNDEKFSLSSYFNLASKEIDIARSIVTCLMLEDFKIGIINEVISTQTSDTILKQGMQRLKNKLSGNFVDIFIKSYVKDAVADKVCGEIDSFVVGAIGAGKIKLVINIINKVAFDFLWDVPEYCDVITLQVLRCYSNDLINGIRNKGKTYAVGNAFVSDKILDYETLFVAYNAVNKGMIKMLRNMSESIDPYQNVYALFSDAAAAGIENVLIKDGISEVVYSSTISETELISILELKIISSKDSIVINNGIVEKKIPLFAIASYCAMADGVESVRYIVESFDVDQNVFENHIESVKNTINCIPYEQRIITERDYSLDGSAVFREPSDNVQKNSIYAFDYKVLGNVYIRGNVDVNFSVSVLSNFYVEPHNELINNSKLTVNGNVNVSHWSSLTNNSELIIKGKFDCPDGHGVKIVNNGIIRTQDIWIEQYADNMTTNDSILYVSGYYYVGSNGYIGGTIIFDGKETQSVKNLRSSYCVEVNNEKGIVYTSDARISGWYKLNNNPLNLNGFTTRAYNGARFGSGDYVTINACGLTLVDSVIANVIVDNSSSLTIPEDANIAIDGNLHILPHNELINNSKLTVKGNVNVSHWSSLTNNGELIIKGKFDCPDGHGVKIVNNGIIRTQGFFMRDFTDYKMSNDSILYVSGDYVGRQYNGYIGGTIIFDGTEIQNIKRLNASTIILENKSSAGVVFETSISPGILFNHKGNKFTLSAGGSFVDYDGDGIKDNVDPDPVTGNACVLEFQCSDQTAGTVSEGVIETIGGTKVSVVATPSFKYQFVKWINSKGTTVSTNATYSFVAKTTDSYTAVFEKRSQPITVQTSGGTINVPSTAKIESEVFVSVLENDGYLYVDGSLMCNGKVVENNSFVMPDESVVLTATFLRNNNYFELSEMISVAKTYVDGPYSVASIEVLQEAILESEEMLSNNISVEDASNCIQKLQDAIDRLENIIVEFDKDTVSLPMNVGTTVSAKIYPDDADFAQSFSYRSSDTSIIDVATTGEITPVSAGTAYVEVCFNEVVLDRMEVTVYPYMVESYGDGYCIIKYCASESSVVVPSCINGVVVTSIGEEAFYRCRNLTSITIPNSVTSIGDRAFMYCDYLPSITIPDSVSSIGDGTFNACYRLTSITIPEGVTSIGNEAFNFCESLTSVTIPDSVVSIGYDAFYYCKSLTRITIPDGVTSIGEGAFSECDSITSVTISDSVTSIGSYAFYNCDSLTDVYYEGTKSQWNRISVGTNNDYLINAKIHYALPTVNIVFSGVSLTLQDNICINLKADKTLFAEVGYENPYVIVDVNGNEYTVSDYRVVEGEYVFDFTDISSANVNDNIKATLYATFDGDLYQSEPLECSLANYCDNEGHTWIDGTCLVCGEACEHTYTDGECAICGLIASKFAGASITLGGNLGVNFVFELSDDVVDDENAKVVFALPNGTKQIVAIKDATVTENGYYVFTCEVNALQMTDVIKAQVIATDYESEVYSYSVVEYAKTLFKEAEAGNELYADAVPLVKAMLNYGANAQIHFDYNTENLANNILSDEDKVINDVKLTAYMPKITGKEEGVRVHGVSLTLNSETELNIYFVVDNEEDVPEFFVNGEFVTPQKVGDYYRIKIADIAAHNLDKEYVVTVGGLTAKYSAMSYGYMAMYTQSEIVKNVIRALYAYSQAAIAYLTAEN